MATATVKVVTIDELPRWGERFPDIPYLTLSIKLSPSLTSSAREIQDRLRTVDPRQVYSPRSHMHVTVKVLGALGEEVKKENLERTLGIIEEVAREQTPFDLVVEGVGIFPSVIYCRVTRGTKEIRWLNRELVKRLGGLAARSEYDGASMKPHVTIMHFATKDVGPLLREARGMTTRTVGSMRVKWIQVWRRDGKSAMTQATFRLGQ